MARLIGGYLVTVNGLHKSKPAISSAVPKNLGISKGLLLMYEIVWSERREPAGLRAFWWWVRRLDRGATLLMQVRSRFPRLRSSQGTIQPR